MTVKLFFQAITKFIAGLLIVGLMLFLPAGSFSFWNAWLLISVLFVPMFLAGIVMMVKNPALLEKRLSAKEEQKEQKAVIALSAIMFSAAFITAGLNYRFSWITMPAWSAYVSAGVFLAAYLMYAGVLRENTYLSRTVGVQEDQKVIDTGMYGVVRHPMYSVTLLLFLSMGIVLGSPISFLILLLYIPIIVVRIKNEEKVLGEGLDGYKEYCQRVRYRLIPLIW